MGSNNSKTKVKRLNFQTVPTNNIHFKRDPRLDTKEYGVYTVPNAVNSTRSHTGSGIYRLKSIISTTTITREPTLARVYYESVIGSLPFFLYLLKFIQVLNTR